MAKTAMRDPRLDKLADVLTRYSTTVRKGDLVQIHSEMVAMPLIEALYAAVLRAGGHPYWTPRSETLQELMLARVDGLAEAPRTLLQVAAVIGPRVPGDVLRTIYGGDDDTFAWCLQELEAHNLLTRHETERRTTYHFTHALIQDTIYRTLLTPRREALHQQVGEAIERCYPAHGNEWVDVLAHHWSQTAHVDKAVHYLALAGEKNLRVYALVEADQCFRQVIELSQNSAVRQRDAFLQACCSSRMLDECESIRRTIDVRQFRSLNPRRNLIAPDNSSTIGRGQVPNKLLGEFLIDNHKTSV